MKATQRREAPAYLQPTTRAWWESVVSRWDLEEHHVRLLTLAAESWDRGQQAREAILRDGLTTETKAGGVRAHPALRVENDCRLTFARLIRELDLDLEAPPMASRPPALRSVR
jgi:P27 family predicted phage terminase small subunit